MLSKNYYSLNLVNLVFSFLRVSSTSELNTKNKEVIVIAIPYS